MRLWKVHDCGSGDEPLLFLLNSTTKPRKKTFFSPYICMYGFFFVSLRPNWRSVHRRKVCHMIKQVKIKNFKSIKDATVNLKNINILIGSNGVGKSNFVTFFELLSKIYQQRLGEYVIEHGGAEKLLHNGSKVSENIFGLFNFADTNAFFFSLKPAAGDILYLENTGDFFNSRGDTLCRYDLWSRTIWDKATKESELVNKVEWRAGYVKDFLKSFTVYHFHDTSASSSMRRPCKIDDNQMLRHDASNLPAFLYKLQQKAPQEFAMIEAVIRMIAPYFKRFTLAPREVAPDTIALTWEEKGSDMYMDATSLSDGTMRFIALATLLLQPAPPETIIVDEPELGLHPAAINMLASLIRKVAAKGKQVIIATQSVNLVNCFGPEDILVSDREKGSTIFKHLKSEDLAVWLKNYGVGTIWEKNIIGGQP
jgi:predicted ATPase